MMLPIALTSSWPPITGRLGTLVRYRPTLWLSSGRCLLRMPHLMSTYRLRSAPTPLIIDILGMRQGIYSSPFWSNCEAVGLIAIMFKVGMGKKCHHLCELGSRPFYT